MTSALHWAKTLTLLGSAVFRFATEDPEQFTVKVVERIKQSRLGSLNKKVPRIDSLRQRQSEVSVLFAEGALEDAANFGQTAGDKTLSLSDRHKIKRSAERLAILKSAPTVSETKSTPPQPPRVLFFLTNSLPHTRSGYTFRSHSILCSLRKSGLEVSAMTRLAYPVVVGRLARQGIECVDGIPYARQLPARYPATLQQRQDKSVELLVARAQEVSANVLHTTTDFNNALTVARVAAILGVPWVYEVRGELESTWLSRHPKNRQSKLQNSDFYRLARAQETACMKAANAVVALSEVSKNQMIQRGVSPEKITVIPNAVQSEFVGKQFSQREVRKELGLPIGKIAGTITSVVDYEGLDDLLRAATLIPDLTVLVVGEGVARTKLEVLAEDLGIHQRVIFVGAQPNQTIWKWYAALDVFVVPRKDTLVCRTVTPIKPIMAQALGLPVVASELPALREITGGLATYIRPSDHEQLAEGIVQALDDNGDPQSRIDWARQHTWEANATRYETLYRLLNT